MAEKGLGGVVIRASRGLRTPYLGDRWWETIEYAVGAAAKAGCRCGSATTIGRPAGRRGDPGEADGQTASQVLASGPEHQGKALVRSLLEVEGPTEVSLEGPLPRRRTAGAGGRPGGRQAGAGPGESFRDSGRTNLECPEGPWQIFSFAVRQLDDRIDYLRPATVARFVEAAYAPYAERLGGAIAGFASTRRTSRVTPFPGPTICPSSSRHGRGTPYCRCCRS